MAGYIALYIVGLLFLAGLGYVFRLIFKVGKRENSEGDPLLNKLEIKQAEQTLTSGKVGGIALYSVIFCALIWFMFYHEPVPEYQLTATELFEEFTSDKAQAIAKYRGEYVLVTGKYVGKELVYGSPAVLLQTSNPGQWIQCNLERSSADQVQLLSLEQELSLKGRVLGKTDSVVIEKCSVLE